jgi:hypothetical protein
VAALDLGLVGYRGPGCGWSSGERRGWMLGLGGQIVATDTHQRAHQPVAATAGPAGPAGQLVRAVPHRGRQVVTPGAARAALEPLLAAGMRLDGTPAVYCAERPGPRLDRYLPMSFALL